MIKILSPHSTTTLKTAEILSKYRPIAPKPGTPPVNEDDPSSSMSQKISQSPYLRNLWPQLQARPTRTRKRGRGGMGPTSHFALKRSKPCASTQQLFGPSPSKTLSFQAFTHPAQVGMTLPLLHGCPPSSKCMNPEILDLNKAAEVIQERDFLKQLQGPISMTTTSVIAPQPIRPVCSKINVSCINPCIPSQISKKSPGEVEEEVESDNLPAVISDSNNRVRLVNSAYKEMMGQPECPWLDSMVRGKRICGEVMIHFCQPNIPDTSGFSCWVRIEWGKDGKNKAVHAFCDVMRLACHSKDYLFTWRFHTTTNSEDTFQPSHNS